jgi:hypothetical protein
MCTLEEEKRPHPSELGSQWKGLVHLWSYQKSFFVWGTCLGFLDIQGNLLLESLLSKSLMLIAASVRSRSVEVVFTFRRQKLLAAIVPCFDIW